MKKFTELLPDYLEGTNINNHASIIDNQNTQILHKIQLLSLWSKLERPILIERVQKISGYCRINVHIHTPQPIKKILFTDYGQDTTFAEEELVTEHMIYIPCSDELPAVMPSFEVTVETWSGLTFKKGYPENDVAKGNCKDHDEFLEILGNLIGIPRRIYTEPEGITTEEVLQEVFPPYFTKVMYHGHMEGDIITEDDYYYMKRLKYFIENYNMKPLPSLMAEILYEWRDVSYSSMKNRNTSIPIRYVDFIETPTMNMKIPGKRYLNMDYSNIEQILNNYAPLTRPLIFNEEGVSYFDPSNITANYVNHVIVSGDSFYSTDNIDEELLAFTPYTVKINNQDAGLFKTDATGHAIMRLQGLPCYESWMNITTETEYEYEGLPYENTIQIDNLISCNIEDWEYARRQGGNSSLYRDAFINEDEELSVGRICLCRTPIVNPNIIDISSYHVEIEFHFVNTMSYIGLCGVTTNEDGTFKEKNVFIKISNYVEPDWNTTHFFEADFIDGTAYFYFDRSYTGISADFSEETDMLYLFGYANHPLTNNQTLSFISGSVDNVPYHEQP